MYKPLFYFLPLLILSAGCNSSKVNNLDTNLDSEMDTTQVTMNHPSEKSTALQLNNVKKWKVDNHMMVFLKQIQHEIESSKITGKYSYKDLSNRLQQQLDSLTSNCTMEGRAHDELHKWLLPFMDNVQNLKKAEIDSTLTQEYIKLQFAIKEFNLYFE